VQPRGAQVLTTRGANKELPHAVPFNTAAICSVGWTATEKPEGRALERARKGPRALEAEDWPRVKNAARLAPT